MITAAILVCQGLYAQQLPSWDVNGMSSFGPLSHSDIVAAFGEPDSYISQQAESLSEEFKYDNGLLIRLNDSFISSVVITSSAYALYTGLPCGGLRPGDPVSKLTDLNIQVVESDLESSLGEVLRVVDSFDDYFYIYHENGVITALIINVPM